MSSLPDYLDIARDHMLRRIAAWIAHQWRDERDIQAVGDLIVMRALQRREIEARSLHLALEQSEYLIAEEAARRAAEALARLSASSRGKT